MTTGYSEGVTTPFTPIRGSLILSVTLDVESVERISRPGDVIVPDVQAQASSLPPLNSLWEGVGIGL